MSDRTMRVLVAALLVIFFAAAAAAVYLRASTDPYADPHDVLVHEGEHGARDIFRVN